MVFEVGYCDQLKAFYENSTVVDRLVLELGKGV